MFLLDTLASMLARPRHPFHQLISIPPHSPAKRRPLYMKSPPQATPPESAPGSGASTPLSRNSSVLQAELTDEQGKRVGDVLLEATGGAELLSNVRPSPYTPATAYDPIKITIPVGFTPEEGSQLQPGWFLGKCLGSGMQGSVFLLTDGPPGSKARSLGRVYKQVNNRMVAEAAGAVTGLEREWVIGQQLNAALRREDGSLPGFMQVGAAVVDADGAFVGLILEQLRGQELTDRLADPHFADVDYILECLRQVLTALDVADTALGFRHRDMRMENVMEHRIEVDDEEEEEEEGGEVKKEEEGGRVGHHARGESQCGGGQREDEQQLPPGFGPKVPLEGLQFKIIDYGHAVVRREAAKDKDAKRKTRFWHRLLPRFPVWAWTEHIYRWVFHGRGDVWRFSRSIGQALESRTWPLRDKVKVERLLKFVGTVTGRKVKAFYADTLPTADDEPAPKSLAARLLGVGGSLFFVRWLRVMVQAYLWPGKPRIRPRAALKLLERGAQGVTQARDTAGAD